MNSDPTLNRQSFVPLYHQVEEYIRTKIRTEQLQEGDPLPTEQELATQLQVSRITIRQAMARLQIEGVVERRQGKGTFVGRPKLVHRESLVRSLEEEIVDQGRTPGFQFISYAEVNPPAKVQEHLRCSPDEFVYRLLRLKLLDDEPMAIERRFFPQRIGVRLEKENLETLPIYQLLKTVLGYRPRHLIETISSSIAAEDEAQVLRIITRHPVLVSEHTMFDEGDLPVEYGKTVFRGDRYQVYLEFRHNA